ncbi:Type II restriction enzyme, methylase subunits [Cystobacter fuscus DSM 2262]|uniref:Type II restriction enzyme, methylase subunits n=2 Tax=Cystobacter fuscus TaxID=43 RepID=S9PJM5_CYSF2|nr:Type II restriction enzyme, methylase subunits [Cystobacter fuscus DSM 2262]
MYPNGLPQPETDDPTQHVFQGSVTRCAQPLQVAVARLLGYRWPDQQADALDAYADTDGIVCIPALLGERPAADRLTDMLAAAWGRDWHPQTLTDLLTAVGHTDSLEDWLRDTFFKQHCELFHYRPFIWHIWDGHREGFSALVNYHKLNHETLKSLTYTYLGDWIRTQELEAKANKSGAGDKLAKAKVLQQRLADILEGEAPLDIFVRWKSIEQQPIGWHPDLDDGVRLNIRPFLTVPDVGAKGAGVLRWKPNIKWGKDRGKNPPDSPWGEDRDNDNHLTLAEKLAAREAA